MDIKLIDYFKAALVEDNEKIPYYELNKQATKLGYIIHPDCCTKSVESWLKTKNVNYNATFYKTWQDITDRSREEILIDQCIHYFFSYGMDISVTKNNGDYSDVPDIQNYQVIKPITRQELLNKCVEILKSGIPLSSDVNLALCDFLIDCVDGGYNFNIDDIKNKEAQCYLCFRLNITPNDKFSLLRYIIYCVTGSTQIIKDRAIYNRVKYGVNFDLSILSEQQLKDLSSIFYRFKPIFLGLKYHDFPQQRRIVNKLRRLANTYHEPLKIGFWESLLNNPMPIKQLIDRIKYDKPSSFKLIQLIQACRDNRLKIGGVGMNIYKIRNKKIWIKPLESNALDMRYDWWDTVESILYGELVGRLREKACSVIFPTDLELSCPVSEKNFVGALPFGSYYKFSRHNMIGIYWEDGWGARDLDLSFIDYEGGKVGWNTGYNLGYDDVLYSGDVTRPEPNASEVLYMKEGCPDGELFVNIYSGEVGTKFKLMFASKKIKTLQRNYMIDPNDIKFQTDVTCNVHEKMIGYVIDNKLYISDLDISDRTVSDGKQLSSQDRINTFKRLSNTFLNLKQLLLDAGFKLYKTGDKDVLDLRDIKKDTLIELFS